MSESKDLSTSGPIHNRNHRNMPEHRRCTALLSDKTRRCQKPAKLGMIVCREHGGNAPQVKAAAKVRLENAADRLAMQLLGMAADDELPPAVKLGALKDALDRAGLSPRQALDVTHELKPYEQTLQRLERGPRQSEPDVIDAEIVETAPACSGCGRRFPAELPPGLDSYPELCGDCRTGTRPTRGPRPSAARRERPESSAYETNGEELAARRAADAPPRTATSEPYGSAYRPARDPGDPPGRSEHGLLTHEEAAAQAARGYRRPRPKKRRV